LFENLAGGSQWFNENSLIIRDLFWQGIQVLDWKAKVVGKRAISPVNSKGCSVGAMGEAPGLACWTRSAGGIDFSHHSFSTKVFMASGLFDGTHEFMP